MKGEILLIWPQTLNQVSSARSELLMGDLDLELWGSICGFRTQTSTVSGGCLFDRVAQIFSE